MLDIAGLPLPKPAVGQACNGCGYCCSVQPCQLAQEFLQCHKGPCVALEHADGRTFCGLVRSPLTYLFKAVHPSASVASGMDADSAAAAQLSTQLAAALGLGLGCDAEDPQ